MEAEFKERESTGLRAGCCRRTLVEAQVVQAGLNAMRPDTGLLIVGLPCAWPDLRMLFPGVLVT